MSTQDKAQTQLSMERKGALSDSARAKLIQTEFVETGITERARSLSAEKIAERTTGMTRAEIKAIAAELMETGKAPSTSGIAKHVRAAIARDEEKAAKQQDNAATESKKEATVPKAAEKVEQDTLQNNQKKQDKKADAKQKNTVKVTTEKPKNTTVKKITTKQDNSYKKCCKVYEALSQARNNWNDLSNPRLAVIYGDKWHEEKIGSVFIDSENDQMMMVAFDCSNKEQKTTPLSVVTTDELTSALKEGRVRFLTGESFSAIAEYVKRNGNEDDIKVIEHAYDKYDNHIAKVDKKIRKRNGKLLQLLDEKIQAFFNASDDANDKKCECKKSKDKKKCKCKDDKKRPCKKHGKKNCKCKKNDCSCKKSGKCGCKKGDKKSKK